MVCQVLLTIIPNLGVSFSMFTACFKGKKLDLMLTGPSCAQVSMKNRDANINELKVSRQSLYRYVSPTGEPRRLWNSSTKYLLFFYPLPNNINSRYFGNLVCLA